MILDAILNFLFTPILAIFNLLPDISISIPTEIYNVLHNVTSGIGYILPMNTILTVLAIKYSIIGFELMWKLILRIKSFIPTMGD